MQLGVGDGAAAGNAPAGAGDGGGLGKLDLRRVNFNYLVQRQKGDPPRWTPLRAFDDGAKTYIQFPPGRLTSEAPPLFVLGANGDAQVMNYRVKGDYYVVDRLFDQAELRLGAAPQQLVRIVRSCYLIRA